MVGCLIPNSICISNANSNNNCTYYYFLLLLLIIVSALEITFTESIPFQTTLQIYPNTLISIISYNLTQSKDMILLDILEDNFLLGSNLCTEVTAQIKDYYD